MKIAKSVARARKSAAPVLKFEDDQRPVINTLANHVDNQKSLNTRQPDAEKRAGSQFVDAGLGEETIEW